MKHYNYYTRRVWLVLFILAGFVSEAQQASIDTIKLYYPGPANQDTTKFASLYVVRPNSSVGPDWWEGIYIQNQPMARILNDTRYIIQCAKSGMTEVWCGNEKKSNVEIDVTPGKNYYIRMTLEEGKKKPVPKLELLDEEAGRRSFDSVSSPPIRIYSSDEMVMQFYRERLLSTYTVDLNNRIGFNEFTFHPPVSARQCFASPELGYQYTYVNGLVSTSYSEIVLIQRAADEDFNTQEDFENYIKKNVEKGNKNRLKKSETVKESGYEKISTPADLSFASYVVEDDTKPEGVDMKGNPFVEVRTWQAYMYKKDVKGNKGRVFQVTFTERGLPEEVHSKEEIFYKMNLLLQSSHFGKVID